MYLFMDRQKKNAVMRNSQAPVLSGTTAFTESSRAIGITVKFNRASRRQRREQYNFRQRDTSGGLCPRLI